jgi:DNA repair photolyase
MAGDNQPHGECSQGLNWQENVMIKDIQAKVLLSRVPQPDTWFGLLYNMNLYRGCQHQCIYCDSRSECYQIENFSDVLVKVNALELLSKELASKRRKGTIGTGAMNDPYMPLERKLNLTGRALEIIATFRFPVHILTKSDLVLRDLDTLKEIGRVYSAVSFTITTADDELGKKVEPGAPFVSDRFRAMQALATASVMTGVTMMPVLPFLEDNEENIRAIVKRAADCGASYIIPWFGMSLRDRQRVYYYEKLDEKFPGLKEKYNRQFGRQYDCPANDADRLEQVFKEMCHKYGIVTRVPLYERADGRQLRML